MKTGFLGLLCMLLVYKIHAAAPDNVSFQTLKGVVTDKISQETLPGATVTVLTTTPVQQTSTGANGEFKFLSVPLGKHTVSVKFLGYREMVISNITLNAGKETVVNITLEEDINKIKEVIISAETDKNKPLNEMSVVSTRTFSVEETQKFAAAVNDPGRMATSYAGVVSSGGDGNNLISIRGNAPNGLLWRMEGVEIPNPNHFAAAGSSGGGISILSAQILGNSDFSTGAFAAEYGNALSGVFDLKLRKGNTEKREYTLQTGFLGIDAAAEGPFKKGYNGSYLVNYRYSTLGMISKLGVNIGDGVTIFQDLSFNVSLPTQKAGIFTLFGFGGLSSQTNQSRKDSILWKEDIYKKFESVFYSNTHAVGMTHTYLFKNQSYLKTVLLNSGVLNGYKQSELDFNYKENMQYDQAFFIGKTTLSSVYTRKFNARHNMRAGAIASFLQFKLKQSDILTEGIFQQKINVNGNTGTAQGFFQINNQWSERFSTHAGLHGLALWLNGSHSLEPRAAVRYKLSSIQLLTFGFGLHSQVQPLGAYFADIPERDGIVRQSNRNLRLSKSTHFVAGYDLSINSFSHIKVETYYQHLYKIPVSDDINNSFSMLNVIDGYVTDKLVNKGLGRNYGMELTYERFLYKNLYYLLSASLFDSEFRASNLKWYNTRFNTGYAGCFTIGREWELSEKHKSRVLGVNVKSMLIGGMRYNGINLEQSIAEGREITDTSRIYQEQNPAYFRTDIRVSVKRNYKNLTATLALDIQNVSNQKNVGGQYYDPAAKNLNYWYQAPLIPVLSYKLEF